jgi:hypothetical protein
MPESFGGLLCGATGWADSMSDAKSYISTMIPTAVAIIPSRIFCYKKLHSLKQIYMSQLCYILAFFFFVFETYYHFCID